MSNEHESESSDLEVARVGDRFEYRWLKLVDPIRVVIDRIHESGDETKSQIKIETAFPLNGSGQHGLYHWGNLNLSSTSSRQQLAKKLAEKAGAIPWANLLEVVCYKTVELWREGAPYVNIASVAEPARVDYLIDRMLPLGETSILHAEGGSGKGWLAVAIGVCVQAGLYLPGIVPTRQGNVLYLDWESGAGEFRRRLGFVLRGAGIENPPPIIHHAMQRAVADEADELRQFCEREKIVFVVIDSLGPATMGDLNDAGLAIRTMNALGTWTGVTRLALAHVSKATAEQGSGRGRTFGSAYYEYMARSVWEARTDPDPLNPTIGLYHRKSNIGLLQESVYLRLHFDEDARALTFGHARASDSPVLSQYASHRVRITTALNSGPLDTNELAEATGIPANELRVELTRLKNVVQLDDARPGRRGTPARWGLKTDRTEDQ